MHPGHERWSMDGPQDWNDEKWTTNLKVMAKNLIPKKWYKKEF